MRGIDLIEALGDLDDRMILDAKGYKKTAPRWIKWCSLAACLCCVLALGAMCIYWIFLETDVPEPLPETLSPVEESWFLQPESEPEADVSAEETIPEPDSEAAAVPEKTVTFQSENFPVRLTVPVGYADDVLVDTDYEYTGNVYEPVEFTGVAFTFYEESSEKTGVEGLVWLIRATPADEFDFESYEAQKNSTMAYNNTVLGTDDAYVYELIHVDDTAGAYNTNDRENLLSYYNYLQAGVEILRGFVADNGLTEQPDWEQRFGDKTVRPVEAFLTTVVERELGLDFEYPAQMTDCFELTGDSLTLFDPVTRAAGEYDGTIWTLQAIPQKVFWQEDFTNAEDYGDGWYGYLMATDYMFAQDDEYVYVLSIPTDVRYDPTNEDCRTSYLEYEAGGIALLNSISMQNDVTINPRWDSDVSRLF